MERLVIEEFGSKFIYRVKYFGGRHVGLMDECIYRAQDVCSSKS